MTSDDISTGSKRAGASDMQEVMLELPLLEDMELELTASKTACAMGEQIRMSPDKIDEMRMAVVEACINAFEYSNANDERVRVGFKILGTRQQPLGLQITVRDNGVGFAPEKVPKPDLGKTFRGEGKRGWGLEIIHGLMDEVDIESGPEGTSVIMRKLLMKPGDTR